MEQWQRLQNKLSKDKHNKGTFYGKEEKQYHEILGDGFDANSQFILSFTIAPFYIILEGFFATLDWLVAQLTESVWFMSSGLARNLDGNVNNKLGSLKVINTSIEIYCDDNIEALQTMKYVVMAIKRIFERY